VRRTGLEVADIFHRHGAAWRRANAGHLSLGQLKVMSAIENCRSAALGGHVERCEDCGHSRIAYNSCRNRHCPRCQGAAAKDWLAAREADLLPVGYFHLVFTLPAEIAAIAYQNKTVVYDLLFRAAAETLLTIAADPKHLGARIGTTAVLHTWGSAMTHHPHVHMIVPGGGISLDGTRWVSCRAGFLLPVRVSSRLFRRLFLTGLADAHTGGRLAFFGDLDGLQDRRTFGAHLAPLRRKNWFVYAKPPFAGPEAVLAYLARYTHRVAIANSRLLRIDESGVTFRNKDYRRDERARYRTMTLAPGEFIRRFLLHVLPKGFHRIRHYGLLASAGCKANIARARELIAVPVPPDPPAEDDNTDQATGATANYRPPCPCCGGRMIIIEVFSRGGTPRGPPRPKPRSGPQPHDHRGHFVASTRRQTPLPVLQLHCHMAADCRHHASHHAEIARPQTAATISGEW
jgi:Putative transposase/Transposase zinc-binding domain